MPHMQESVISALEILDNIRRVKGEVFFGVCSAVFNLQSAQVIAKLSWDKEAGHSVADLEEQLACATLHLCAATGVSLEEVLAHVKPIWDRFTA